MVNVKIKPTATFWSIALVNGSTNKSLPQIKKYSENWLNHVRKGVRFICAVCQWNDIGDHRWFR